jgi:hypothetical protein
VLRWIETVGGKFQRTMDSAADEFTSLEKESRVFRRYTRFKFWSSWNILNNTCSAVVHVRWYIWRVKRCSVRKWEWSWEGRFLICQCHYPSTNHVMATRPDTHLLSQLNIGVNTDSNGRRLTVVEEVKADKTRWCTTVLMDYRLKLQWHRPENVSK